MKFIYKALTQEGVVSEGTIEEMSKDAAVLTLQKKGLVVVFVDEQKEIISPFDINKINAGSFFKKKIKVKDVVIFSRQIATLFEAGVSALKAFRMLAEENENETLRKELTQVADDIQTGVSLSKAMETHVDIFSPFYISMVRAGEESGKLNESFLYLADYMERAYELKQKTKKALTYPAFVVATFIIIMTIMVIFVIPKMAEMLAQQGQALPLFTKIILGISNVLTGYWYILLPCIFGFSVWIKKWASTPEGNAYLDQLKLNIPIIKNTYQKIFLSRLADNLNTMLTSGVSIVNALEITAEVVDNYVYQQLILRVSSKVQNGKSLSQALSEEGDNIPNIMIQMVKIGEETGELGYMLKNMSRFYRQEVERAIDSMVAMIEPIMILGLGLGVGVLMSSVMMPMYNVATGIE